MKTKMIGRKATRKNAFPLTGGWINSKNHWNNRAAVIECTGGYTALQSYGTIVLVLYRGRLYRTWWGYSRTTANHINRFCDMFGFKGINKAAWEKMPVYETGIDPLGIEFERVNNPYCCDYFKSFKIIYPRTKRG